MSVTAILIKDIEVLAVIWSAWIAVGVLYDPVVDPRARNGAKHTHSRRLAMLAYCETLRAWIGFCTILQAPPRRGDTIGELLARLFVMLSRKTLRRVTSKVLPW